MHRRRVAAKTTPLLTNGCCTMTFAYWGDVHCQHGDQPNQIINFHQKVIWFQFLQSVKFVLGFFPTKVLFFVSQRLDLDAFCRKRLFDDDTNYVSNTQRYLNFPGKFYTYLIKRSIGVILAKNYENILKLVKVIYSKPCAHFSGHRIDGNSRGWYQCGRVYK